MKPAASHYLPDLIAVLLSLAAILASALVTRTIFEGIPHIEDEIAYTWQAKALTQGQLTVPSPPHPKSYLVPFVVDHDGLRFGKYPPGWPAVLAAGVLLGLRAWVNPLLAGLGVWLTYRLGRRIFSPGVGLLAAGLTVSSPFFLMNSASLLSHPLGLVLSAGFTLCWLRAFQSQAGRGGWAAALLAALLLGWMILTRPLTALGLALPFTAHGLYLLWRGAWAVRGRLLAFVALALVFVGIYFGWQSALTGDALLNPYTLWWPYDRVGFGPGVGRVEGGHNLLVAWSNLQVSLSAGASDLFGWGTVSWLFLPVGLWAGRRNRQAWLLVSLFLGLVLVYLAYWIGSALFGPRYYYESLFSLTLVSAAGIAWAAGWLSDKRAASVPETPPRKWAWSKVRPLLVLALLALLVGMNLLYYLPARLESMHGLYQIEAADQQPFLDPEVRALAPALVIVHTERWMEYGALLDLEDPWLTSPFIFAWSVSAERDAQLEGDFPGRSIYHYYPALPFELYTAPLENH